ncbi:unnamed protein product [Tetraodon nigroviridis]|uniref:F-actin monooxygenase n=1 Tax=Tetraodon nigroviridis TaxID=99883 RepID=Q4SK81_TETNG|nr:unnamed protein product [Tetraodon nigroviridis]
MGQTEDEHLGQAGVLFENFVQASTCKGTLQAFSILCRQLELDPLDYSNFYSCLKAAVSTWKVKPLWTKLDKRAQQKVYSQNKACQGTRCLIIGSGPCGLRTAIELALLGCKVVVIEKRDTFSRNNVLHLWPFTIHDLRGLGAKKFYGKFCAGSIDHISIRQLQLMLLKVCLILGVEIHVNVEFTGLAEPPKEPSDVGSGWRAELQPSNHPVSDFHFDVVIGADGRKSTLDGFTRKEFRGKLAIAITANFVNRNTTAEAKVEEISGVAFIFNQKFFLELKEETGIDLENIVYYRDNTHYFVMTAKKQSLLDKGVIINDHMETERLLSVDNINHEALLSYAREAADFGTNYQLPSLDYAINHYGQPDVAMFDFTCMYASENAALIREKHGHQLVVALVGDSLLEPFWPMGTGCARGFLAAFDTAWMVKGWAQGRKPHEILAERESIYRLLPQTTPDNISKNFEQYSIDPATRYPNLNVNYIRPHQVCHGNAPARPCQEHLPDLCSRFPVFLKHSTDVCHLLPSGAPSVHQWSDGLLSPGKGRTGPPIRQLDQTRVRRASRAAADLVSEANAGLQRCRRHQPHLFLEKRPGPLRPHPPPEARSNQENKAKEASVWKRSKFKRIRFASTFCPQACQPPTKKEDTGALLPLSLPARTESCARTRCAPWQRSCWPSSKRTPQRFNTATGVHPVPCPTVHAHFSSGPLSSAGRKDPVQTETHPTRPLRADSSPAPDLSSSSPLGDKNGHLWSSSGASLPLKDDSGHDINLRGLQEAPQEMFVNRELAENGHVKREVSCLLESHGGVLQKAADSLPTAAPRYDREVSSAIDAKAQILAILYETDHRPNAAPCVARREAAAGLGGSDTCHFCSKRVYVMERLSAEGHFFHRECFRCDACGCSLRLGGHAFDSREGAASQSQLGHQRELLCGGRRPDSATSRRPVPLRAPLLIPPLHLLNFAQQIGSPVATLCALCCLKFGQRLMCMRFLKAGRDLLTIQRQRLRMHPAWPDRIQQQPRAKSRREVKPSPSSSSSTSRRICRPTKKTYRPSPKRNPASKRLWLQKKRRTKCSSQRRQRPLSEGTLRCPEPPKDEPIPGKHGARWAADAWGVGRDLPSLLQEVSLQGSGGPGPASSGGAQPAPRRRLNLFMSLRLKKQRASEREGQEHEMQKEIRTMLSNLRNKRKRGRS